MLEHEAITGKGAPGLHADALTQTSEHVHDGEPGESPNQRPARLERATESERSEGVGGAVGPGERYRDLGADDAKFYDT